VDAAGRLSDVIDGELGRFLRSRREAVRPEDVGLPTGSRRRTPGLRRAEVATLAGISVDYLVRLEQGRDQHPSAQVLAAIAGALKLDEADLAELRQLAAVTNGRELCPNSRPLAQSVRPMVKAMLDSLEPTAAFVLNRLADVLAWNRGFERIARPVGMLDADPPNLARYTFGDERARVAYPDWDAVADDAVSGLRAGCASSDPMSAGLVAALTERGGAAFTDRWTSTSIVAKRSGTARLVHPEVGELRLAFEIMALADGDEQRLIVWLPADQTTSAALDRLYGRVPGALHAVTRAAS
jgi:transcriptional regulator with XRE-family HTH domain